MALSQVGAMISATPGRPLSRFVRKLSTERGRLSTLYANHDLTLRATFDTGYQQLSPEAAACYRAIGAHQPATDIGLPALAAALGLPEDDVPVDELLAVQLARAGGA